MDMELVQTLFKILSQPKWPNNPGLMPFGISQAIQPTEVQAMALAKYLATQQIVKKLWERCQQPGGPPYAIELGNWLGTIGDCITIFEQTRS